jgi:hypothetical protein
MMATHAERRNLLLGAAKVTKRDAQESSLQNLLLLIVRCERRTAGMVQNEGSPGKFAAQEIPLQSRKHPVSARLPHSSSGHLRDADSAAETTQSYSKFRVG